MKQATRDSVKKILKEFILAKIRNYEAETEYKPFFDAIFSKKQILTASIIQSFYTSFGMSGYEQIAVALARGAGYEADRQYEILGEIMCKQN